MEQPLVAALVLDVDELLFSLHVSLRLLLYIYLRVRRTDHKFLMARSVVLLLLGDRHDH